MRVVKYIQNTKGMCDTKMKATLVVMAAGMGARYGGDKQIEGIGPDGEILMEYSIYDAVRAGFTKVVFIIKEDMLDTVKKLCGDRLSKCMGNDGNSIEVFYAFQDYSSIPSFYRIPEERTKPFGTVHAVLCAKEFIQEPFVVINADDYYGISAYKTILDEVLAMPESGMATMVGYLLKNTVSANGAVTRGICREMDGYLQKVTETYKIRLFPDGTIRDTASDENGMLLDPEAIVSMNIWGFTPWIFEKMNEYFENFLRKIPAGDLKAECLLPVMVDEMIKKNTLRVSMLRTDAHWFGMTYKEDREAVREELFKLHEKNIYPKTLHI